MGAFKGGFAAPAADSAMCAHRTAWGPAGLLPSPRPCKRAAKPGERFCGLHISVAAKRAPVDVREGGFCVVCAGPARVYEVDGTRIALCGRHGKSLERALREGR